MPAPSSYTEDSLKTFMINTLGGAGVGVAGALSLTTASAVIVRAVTVVERILGVTDVVDFTGSNQLAKLEAIAAWRAWVAASDSAATSFDMGSDGDTMKLSQLYDHIAKRLAAAESEAMIYSEVQAFTAAGGVAVITTLSGAQRPYGWSEWS